MRSRRFRGALHTTRTDVRFATHDVTKIVTTTATVVLRVIVRVARNDAIATRRHREADAERQTRWRDDATSTRARTHTMRPAVTTATITIRTAA
jgi:hypothetical protein